MLQHTIPPDQVSNWLSIKSNKNNNDENFTSKFPIILKQETWFDSFD